MFIKRRPTMASIGFNMIIYAIGFVAGIYLLIDTKVLENIWLIVIFAFCLIVQVLRLLKYSRYYQKINQKVEKQIPNFDDLEDIDESEEE